jgi:DNA-binding sugar fermentation-stimulating protein
MTYANTVTGIFLARPNRFCKSPTAPDAPTERGVKHLNERITPQSD